MSMRKKRKIRRKGCPGCKSKDYKITRDGELHRAFGNCPDCGLEVEWDWAGKGKEFD